MGKKVHVKSKYLWIVGALVVFFCCVLILSIQHLLHSDGDIIVPVLSGISSFVGIIVPIIKLWRDCCYSRQDHKEPTFQKLLEQKQNIIEKMQMTCEVWDICESEKFICKANDIFRMMCHEVQCINLSLFMHGRYEDCLTENSQNEALGEYETIRDVHNSDKIMLSKMRERYQCKLINTIYEIDKEKYDKAQSAQSNEQRNRGCFNLFYQKHKWNIEAYFYQLCQIINLMDSLSNDDFDNYVKKLRGQMTKYEAQVAYFYIITYVDSFRKLKNLNKVIEIFH